MTTEVKAKPKPKSSSSRPVNRNPKYRAFTRLLKKNDEEMWDLIVRQVRRSTSLFFATPPEGQNPVLKFWFRLFDADQMAPRQLIFAEQMDSAYVPVLFHTLQSNLLRYDGLRSLCFWNTDFGDKGAANVVSAPCPAHVR